LGYISFYSDIKVESDNVRTILLFQKEIVETHDVLWSVKEKTDLEIISVLNEYFKNFKKTLEEISEVNRLSRELGLERVKFNFSYEEGKDEKRKRKKEQEKNFSNYIRNSALLSLAEMIYGIKNNTISYYSVLDTKFKIEFFVKWDGKAKSLNKKNRSSYKKLVRNLKNYECNGKRLPSFIEKEIPDYFEPINFDLFFSILDYIAFYIYRIFVYYRESFSRTTKENFMKKLKLNEHERTELDKYVDLIVKREKLIDQGVPLGSFATKPMRTSIQNKRNIDENGKVKKTL
jgi:hypothetical protein